MIRRRTSRGDSTFDWLAAVVLAHFMVAIIHGVTHAGAHVLLSTAATLYVLVIILAGPLIGLALMTSVQRIGSWVIAAALAGSLVFGVVNHFVYRCPDHVAYVDPHWRPLFATTAALLALTEALGCGLAIRSAKGKKSS